MTQYVPGDRVWVLVEGYDWWPARVLSDEELLQIVGERRVNCDIGVAFYKGTQTEASVYELNSVSEAANICYFETSSQKAVTNNEDLIAAITNATEDETANPLKTEGQHVAIGGGGGGVHKASALTRAERRARLTASAAAAATSAGGRGGARHAEADAALSPISAGSRRTAYRHLPIETLQELAQSIRRDCAAGEVSKVCVLLCQLDGVDVHPAELEKTSIGVAVGEILGSEACAPLWALARALISFWARHLPVETLRAIRSAQEYTRALYPQSGNMITQDNSNHVKNSNATLLASSQVNSAGAALDSTMRSMKRTRGDAFGGEGVAAGDQAPQSPLNASSSSFVTSPNTSSQRLTFFGTLLRLLDNPSDTTRVSSEAVERVARNLVQSITSPDDRALLLTRLNQPEMSFLREQLLSGRWTARQYLEQPDEMFKTEKEKTDEADRLRERLQAEESAKMANINLTSMFTCPNCHKNRCHFYEQQTRSADEPTTKFITCLECKTTWTQE